MRLMVGLVIFWDWRVEVGSWKDAFAEESSALVKALYCSSKLASEERVLSKIWG